MHEQEATSERPQDNACWNAAATAWEAQRARMWEATHPVGEGLVEMAGPRPSETVLELAAGAGDTGFLAARALGPDGLLISSDRSQAMLETARRRAAELGLGNVEFRELDAERLELESSSVDAVLCRWGYMLMSDPLGALRETRRVLRPGGRVALAVWAPREENPWSAVIVGVLTDAGVLPAEDPDEPGPFRLGDRGELESLIRNAGFESVELRDLPVLWRFSDSDEYWDTMASISPSLSRALTDMPQPRVAELRAELATRSAPFATGEGRLELPGVSIGALARV
jgi:SAM-dependent methyltransferase